MILARVTHKSEAVNSACRGVHEEVDITDLRILNIDIERR